LTVMALQMWYRRYMLRSTDGMGEYIDPVISDEARRSKRSNASDMYGYFMGYKLGLTIPPKYYLRRFDTKNPFRSDPGENERRILLDTYRTFGCERGTKTLR
jgi:type I restriction enzyme, R subunit